MYWIVSIILAPLVIWAALYALELVIRLYEGGMTKREREIAESNWHMNPRTMTMQRLTTDGYEYRQPDIGECRDWIIKTW